MMRKMLFALVLICLLFCFGWVVLNRDAVGSWVRSSFSYSPSPSELTRIKVVTLEAATESYQMDNDSRLPSSLEELIQPNVNNMNEPYLESDDYLYDSWENRIVFTSTGSDFEILSLGADGKAGGEGEDADISSKD